MAAKVQTVLGDIEPSQLGRTLTHEHLAMEFMHFYKKPPKYIELSPTSIILQQVGNLRQYPYSSPYNLMFNDNDSKRAVIKDVAIYKKSGGGTIVENSTDGLKPDPEFFKQVSKETGVHIVMGTGYYIEDTRENKLISKEAMYEHMVKELVDGVDGIKAGYMGEIASVWPIKDTERKAITAAGEVQEQIGCGVSFHPHREIEAPFEIIRLYLEAGGSRDKVIMSHLDRTLFENEKLLEFAELDTYCQFDLFGVEVSYYQLNPNVSMPSDAQRLDKIRLLVDEGYEDRILMSHDIHTKHRLAEFGGHGYSHIINNVLPLMRHRGFPDEVIDKITIQNPATWLAMK